MRLTRIRVADFKRHEALELEPAAGLTIIRGPNEAGKSSLQQAIGLALYRKYDSAREDLRRAQRWGTDDPPEVELDFEADGRSGTLRKRFGGSRGVAELTYDGESIRDQDRIADAVSELTGIPTESFFRATASVGHAELAQVSGDEPDIQDRLQQAISGTDRGTARAKRKLETAIHRYRTQGQKNPGLLKVVGAEIAQLEADLADGERALTRLEADRVAWMESSQRHVELEGELRRASADLAEARRAQMLAAERDAAAARYDRYRRAAELVRQERELRGDLPTDMPIEHLREGVRRAESLALDLSELEATLDAGADARGAFEPEPAPPPPTRWLLLAALSFVAAAATWFVLGGLIGIAIAAVLFVVAIAGLVQSVRLATRRRRYGLAQQLAAATASELSEAERPRRERHRALQRELEGLLGSMGFGDVEGARAVLAVAERHGSELSRIEGELRGLDIDERDVRVLEAERDTAANESTRAGHALSAMGPIADDPAPAVRAAQREVELLSPRRDEARSEADQAQGRVDANMVDAEEVAAVAEQLVAARERQAELERRVVTYEATLAAIVAAEETTLKTAARFLEERMGPAISTITEGRYDEIAVDEKNLAFQVRVPETGELVDVSQLSQGTADQLYLTARLGLVQLVTMDRRPPLILDDPFVTFDIDRGERALRLVRDVAAERGFQVLYLTCSDRFDDLADRLVVLDGPAVETRPAGGDSTTEEPPVATRPAEPARAPEPDPQPGADAGPELRLFAEDESDTGEADA